MLTFLHTQVILKQVEMSLSTHVVHLLQHKQLDKIEVDKDAYKANG